MWISAILLLVGVPETMDDVTLLNGGTCRIVQSEAGEYSSVLQVQYLNRDGDALWSSAALPVRRDAAAGTVIESPRGEILAACAFGEGYTDILLQLFDSTGNLLNADTISLNCYDTPQALAVTGSGFALAWDSWSEERGVHLAFVDHGGTVLSTDFVSETVNPGPVALVSAGSVLVLAVSPLLAQGDILNFYSTAGERIGAEKPILPDAAQLIQSASVVSGDSVETIWETLPDSCGATVETVSRHPLPPAGV